MIEFINRFRSKYFLLLLVVSVSFISTNSEASSFYWRNGTDSSFWENQMIFVCMGLIDDNKDGLPEICEGYELK